MIPLPSLLQKKDFVLHPRQVFVHHIRFAQITYTNKNSNFCYHNIDSNKDGSCSERTSEQSDELNRLIYV